MSIWITGDIHGDPVRFSTEDFPEQKTENMCKEHDFVIICGDFGFVWDYTGESKYEKWWLDWLEEKPFTILFVDGNHENFNRLNSYPIEEWHGGKVHKIRPSVIHLMRGEVYEIEGKKFFAFGGASSHDIQDGIIDPSKDEDWRQTARQWDKEFKLFRIKNVSWWEQELPSKEEMENGRMNLAKHDYKVDYIISHCASSEVAAIFSRGLYRPDIMTDYLSEIIGMTEFKEHFFGHYHINYRIMNKYQILYEKIMRIV